MLIELYRAGVENECPKTVVGALGHTVKPRLIGGSDECIKTQRKDIN